MKGVSAVVLAGGLGDRLRPLTLVQPKPLLPILDRPMLEWLLEPVLSHPSVLECHIAAGYLAHQFADWAASHPAVRVVAESRPLGTAGPLVQLQDLLQETVLVLNGDTLFPFDLDALLRSHRATGALLTLVAAQVPDASRYGALSFDSKGRLATFGEKNASGPGWVNAGCYALDKRCLLGLPSGQPCSLERELIPQMLAGGRTVQVLAQPGELLDIGLPSTYLEAQFRAIQGAWGMGPGDEWGEGLWGAMPELASDVILRGPIFFGPGVEVGAGASLEGPAVIGARSLLADNIRLRRALLLPGAALQSSTGVFDSIVGANTVLELGSTLRGEVVVSHQGHLQRRPVA